MMTLSVKHAALFMVGVNDLGEVKGGGVIVYDLDPNLCGVANLVKYTNMAINILAKLPDFYHLSSEITEAAKLSGEGAAFASNEYAHRMGQEVSKEVAEKGQEFLREAAKFVYRAFRNYYLEKFKGMGAKMIEKMGESDKEENEERKRVGCTSVGPTTLGEAAAQVGASAVESVPLTPNMPMGVPMVPGVTQVQYNYKGLEHGPEQRQFDIEGNLGYWDGQTRMVLKQSGDVYGGGKDLFVVYQVNFKTEKKPFPAWRAFTNKPGVVWNSNGSKAQKPPEDVEKLAQQMGMNLDAADSSMFAYMEDTGAHRNGVKPWEEYEYVWFLQKLDSGKVLENFAKKPSH